jgi:hypothetical protein
MTQQLILIAGPYRSGTDGVQTRIDENLARLENAALAVYQRGMFRLLANGWLCLWQKRRDLSPWVMKSVKRCFTPLLTGLLPNAMPFIALPENPEGLIWILKWRRNWG